VGNGTTGPVTRKLQQLFFDAIRGRNPKYAAWVRGVKIAEAATAGARR
jgi:branched-chain amino acid aminotransferase